MKLLHFKSACAATLSFAILSTMFPAASVFAEEEAPETSKNYQLSVSVSGPGSALTSLSDQKIEQDQTLSFSAAANTPFSIDLTANEGAEIQRMSVNGYTVTDIPDQASHYLFEDGVLSSDQDIRIYFVSEDTTSSTLSLTKEAQNLFEHNPIEDEAGEYAKSSPGKLFVEPYWIATGDEDIDDAGITSTLYLNDAKETASVSGGADIELQTTKDIPPGNLQVMLPITGVEYEISDPDTFGLAEDNGRYVLINKTAIRSGNYTWILKFSSKDYSVLDPAVQESVPFEFTSYLSDGNKSVKYLATKLALNPGTTRNERLAIARKLGVGNDINNDAYLKHEFWNSHDILLLNLENWNKLNDITGKFTVDGSNMPQIYEGERFSVRVHSIDNFIDTPMPWGGTISNVYMNLTNGHIAFCGNGLLAPPLPSVDPVSNPTLVDNQALKKVLYYGYNGPSNQLGPFTVPQQVILTDEFVSYAFSGNCIARQVGDGWHWKQGVGAWYDNIQRLPDPPENYHVYKIEFARSTEASWTGTYETQPVVYGVTENLLGNLSLTKISSVSQAGGPQYSLAGAQYGVYQSEADADADHNRIGTLTTDENGSANTISNLDAKTYYVKEIAAPAGFEKDERVYSINVAAGQTAVVSASDVPKLGSLTIYKVDGANAPLAGVEFTLYNNNGSTIWIDKNSDGRLQDGETVQNGQPVASVTTDTSGIVSFKNISYGNYQLAETRTPAGYNGMNGRMDVTISASTPDVSLNITNKKIEIGTTARADNGTQELQANGDVTIKDTVAYKNLTPGTEYTLKGTLMNKDTGSTLKDGAGKDITAQKKFTPQSADGTVVVDFKLDASKLAGITTVVFEDLFGTNGSLLASHKDINDKDQTVKFISIGTEAKTDTGSHVQIIKNDVIINDTVSYTGLTPGTEYTLKGTLMNKDTGKPMTDSSGKEITAETTFTPKEANGTAVVVFKFNAVGFDSIETVAFEKLYNKGTVVAVHEDINDKNQQISFRFYSLQIKKKDSSTNNAILNSAFEFSAYSDKDCTQLVKTVSGDTKTGTALFDKLTSGTTFYIKETKAPAGYNLSDQVIKASVQDDGLYINDKKVETDNYLCTMDFSDTAMAINLKLHKKNDLDEPLAGAVFGIYTDQNCTKLVAGASEHNTADGKVTGFMTGNDGSVAVPLQPNATYYVKEIAAPQGYAIPVDQNGNVHVYVLKVTSDPSTNSFKVNVDGKDYTQSEGFVTIYMNQYNYAVGLKIINKRGSQLPDTGYPYWIWPLVMLLFCLVGIAMLDFRNKRTA